MTSPLAGSSKQFGRANRGRKDGTPSAATEGEARRNQTYPSGKAGVSGAEMIFSARILAKAGFLPGFFVPMMAIKTSRMSLGKC